MKATIWHNPKCKTSSKTLAILENLSKVDVTVIEYLKDPPTRDKLAQLYADAGITPQEGLRLRVKDLDFGQLQIVVRNAKGRRDRVTMLPQSLVEVL
ncbi:MAG: hypothetical protein AAFQ90_10710, partial [Pseudomonadota bacterium]